MVVAIRSRAAGQGYQVGLATVVQLQIAAGLVDECRITDHPAGARRNLNTHRTEHGLSTRPFPRLRPREQQSKRLEFHHTPKHGSWLNMAEIEFSVLARACLKGRNPDEDALQRNISAYEAQRNTAGTTINWRFTAQDARAKMRRLYPDTSTLTEY